MVVSFEMSSPPRTPIDFSLYLVTGRHLLPPNKVCTVVSHIMHEAHRHARTTMNSWKKYVILYDKYQRVAQLLQALQGGVTVVQIREKTADTAEVRRRSSSRRCTTE
jgi:thiamine monophosphate synthase